jgi:O-acetyl-ADP-ribose deacetylase (regulator of RNase III)
MRDKLGFLTPFGMSSSTVYRLRPPAPQTTRLVLKQADITREAVDAIVNAANERMLGGGGVDGAIHRAAGKELLEACKRVPEKRPGVRCPTGEAVPIKITWPVSEGNLPQVRYIINTVGPIYQNAEKSAPLLRSAYRNSLLTAIEHNCRSIAFPAISCGVYGYPLREAARVALEAVQDTLGESPQQSLQEVRFCLFSEDALKTWTLAAEQLQLERVKEGAS